MVCWVQFPLSQPNMSGIAYSMTTRPGGGQSCTLDHPHLRLQFHPVDPLHSPRHHLYPYPYPHPRPHPHPHPQSRHLKLLDHLRENPLSQQINVRMVQAPRMYSRRRLRSPIPMMRRCDHILHVNAHAAFVMKWTLIWWRKNSVQPDAGGQMRARLSLKVSLEHSEEEGLLQVEKLLSLMIST